MDAKQLSLFVLGCIDYAGQRPVSPTSSTLSSQSLLSTLSIAPQDSDAIVVSEYEKKAYYNGITADGEHPYLLYRSDLSTNPFPMPKSRLGHAHLPSKSLRGVHDTPLNKVWDTVGFQIRDLVKGQNVRYSSIDPARFLTYGEDDVKTLSPIVIWIGVYASFFSLDIAKKVSEDILALLVKNGVNGAVVEWREAAPSKLAGPPLMRVVGNSDATAHVRRIFTPALNMPLATREKEDDDAQGSLTLYFHEGKDKHGNASDKVLGVSNCHVLRKNTTVDYVFRGSGGPKQEIVDLKEKKDQDEEDEKELSQHEEDLRKQQEAIARLNTFYNEVKNHWSDIGSRNIGHVCYAKAISVDVGGGTCYTEDWAAFEVDEAKVKPQFGGTFVDLGTAITPEVVTAKFYPQSGGMTSFKYPTGRKLKIRGTIDRELLAKPDMYDSDGQPCIIVGKDGTKTGITFGRYAGLESFLCDELGVESRELGIYNWDKNSGVFSDKGDSGALIWDGLGRMLGQLHSGQFKGGSTTSHVTYATPGWWLLERIKAEFPSAIFFQDTWSA
ncbi:hypothetical protein FRC04_004592 [Tulasnella sp. 424]|nr:hypothetical protein FRC04_004592 [Tulasnella sp. 424]